MKKQIDNIEQIEISKLVPAEYNPRRLTKKQHDDIKASLEKYGFVDPVIVNTHPDRQNVIIGGHQRVKVWKSMGNDTAPCVTVNYDLEKEKELNIRLNKNTGEFDYDMLANHFEETELMKWGFEEYELLGKELQEENEHDFTDMYSQQVGEVIYEPKETNHKIEDLYKRDETFDYDIEKLANQKLKMMLYARANYFSTFYYEKIADYYAYQATNEEKKIFERLGLVLLDKQGLVENGFASLLKDVVDNE